MMTNSLYDESMDIAVVGMACRVPGANDVEQFWENLRDGVESISRFSAEQLQAAGVPSALATDPQYVPAAGTLDNYDQFDAHFFGYSAKDAAMLDPQHRLFLECAWNALEKAGYMGVTEYSVGVYAGCGMNTYLTHNVVSNYPPSEPVHDYPVMIAADKDFLATKASYKLNLRGPGVTVQTACSTSLVAIHQACQSIRAGECDMALAGGISVRVPHEVGYRYQEGMILSPDGSCRAFDAAAQGTVLGSGVGVIVLKLLADALDDDDTILAVIKGSAINNDGALKAGYTAPGVDMQAAVIREAQGVANVSAESISYIETHGTGTPIGDPIEISALTKAFRSKTAKTQFCAIGSVKTNIGHLDAAAGVIGLIKTVLALQHRCLPPSLHYKKPNPQINFGESPFFVNATLQEWMPHDAPRIAGVSSFGIGGTNAHLIVQEAPIKQLAAQAEQVAQLLPLSALSEQALNAQATQLADYFAAPTAALNDVAFTLQVGRKPLAHRRFVIGRNATDCIAALQAESATTPVIREPTVAFMLSGQGAQYVNMGRDLYRENKPFRDVVDTCCDQLHQHLGLDLRDILYPEVATENHATKLRQTSLAQPALFVIEYALARMWQHYGVKPQALIGHSIGEYAAACLAGVFSLDDALRLVALRGQLMQQMPSGAMLAVSLPEHKLQGLLIGGVEISVVNAPERCVVSGSHEAIDAFKAHLESQGVSSRPLHTSHAFHSAMMEPIVAEFAQQVALIERQPPSLPLVSNVTGRWMTDDEAVDPNYWATHLRHKVRFADGLAQLMQTDDLMLLEVGPGQTLRSLAQQHPKLQATQQALSSLRHPRIQQPDDVFMLSTLGQLWTSGVAIDWAKLQSGAVGRVPLPTYPFERRRYWLEPQATPLSATPSLTTRLPQEQWFSVPSWYTQPLPIESVSATEHKTALIFIDAAGVGSSVVDNMDVAGWRTVRVQAGDRFAQIDENSYQINPQDAEEFEHLFATLAKQDIVPTQLLYLWTLDDVPMAEARSRAFESLLYAVRASGLRDEQQLELIAVTSGVQSVIGNEIIRPINALTTGLLQIIPQEYPQISCRHIDLPAQLDHCGKILWQEISAETSTPHVALRHNRRWVRDFRTLPIDAPEHSDLPLKTNGVYLITGGLGGIGLTMASHLAEQFSATIILAGRTPFPEREQWQSWLATHAPTEKVAAAIRQLMSLEAGGATFQCVSVDVSDAAAVEAMIKREVARFGRIDGIIHAAGVAGGGLMQLRETAQIDAVFSPKVLGTIALDSAIRTLALDLDFLLLCSSINVVVSRAGQADYVAANAFMDAFATANSERKVISVNWETWLDVGMAARATASERIEIHPLLQRRLIDTSEAVLYASELHADKEWVLHEHRIMGHAVMPGTGYLSMVHAAVAALAGQQQLTFADVQFLTPLIVAPNEPRMLYLWVEGKSDSFDFRVVSSADDKTWQQHTQGRVLTAPPSLPSELLPFDLQAIEARCSLQIVDPMNQPEVGEFILERQEDSLIVREKEGPGAMTFGPHWHLLRQVSVGDSEAVAQLRMVQDSAEFQDPLNPALLDFATSFPRIFQHKGSYLPYAYERLTLLAALPEIVISHAICRQATSQSLHFDVRLYDQQGGLLADIQDFVLMRVAEPDKLASTSGDRAGSGLPANAQAAIRRIHTEQYSVDEAALSPQEGVEVFRRALLAKQPQLIVSTIDLNARLTRMAEQPEAQVVLTVPKETHPRPPLLSVYAPPRTDNERRVVVLWQAVLGVEPVGINDDFFELGGDSLLMTQLHAQFRQQFDSDLSIANLMQYATIGQLSDFLWQKSAESKLEHVKDRVSRQKQALRKRRKKTNRHKEGVK